MFFAKIENKTLRENCRKRTDRRFYTRSQEVLVSLRVTSSYHALTASLYTPRNIMLYSS